MFPGRDPSTSPAPEEANGSIATKSAPGRWSVANVNAVRAAGTRLMRVYGAIETKRSARRRIGPADFHAQGVIYLTEAARFRNLLDLPEGADLGRAVNEAMRLIEEHNPDLKGVLPRTYSAIDSGTSTREKRSAI